MRSRGGKALRQNGSAAGEAPLSIAELLALLQAKTAAIVDSPRDLVAYLAFVLGGAFVVAGALTKTMIPLRWLAVGGNVGFVVFGALHPQWTTLVVAAVLLPINVHRARQMMRLTRRVRAAEASSDLTGVWLRPYMKARRCKAGTVLFRRGDEADRLYCLAEGEIELTEIGVRLDPGKIFGEIAFFAPDKRRTHTARCVTPCTVLSIDEPTLKQLYFQNPAFGFHLIGLVAGRLSEDVRRIEQRFIGDALPVPPKH